MQVILFYNFGGNKPEMINTIRNWLSQYGMRVSDDNTWADRDSWDDSDDPAEEVYLKEAAEDCKKLATRLKEDFVITGVIDTSYTAGEYMDFRFEYKDGKLSGKYSDWYQHGDLDDFETYEEMVENLEYDIRENGLSITKEEFEYYKDKDCFILETENGFQFSATVPLVYTYEDEE